MCEEAVSSLNKVCSEGYFKLSFLRLLWKMTGRLLSLNAVESFSLGLSLFISLIIITQHINHPDASQSLKNSISSLKYSSGSRLQVSLCVAFSITYSLKILSVFLKTSLSLFIWSYGTSSSFLAE